MWVFIHIFHGAHVELRWSRLIKALCVTYYKEAGRPHVCKGHFGVVFLEFTVCVGVASFSLFSLRVWDPTLSSFVPVPANSILSLALGIVLMTVAHIAHTIVDLHSFVHMELR